jgi:hypothetical protein
VCPFDDSEDGRLTIQECSLPLNQPKVPVFNRKPLEHSVIDNSNFSRSQSFDDIIAINTQAGSQWDGLRHVVHEQSGQLYNGVTKEQITGARSATTLGIDSKTANFPTVTPAQVLTTLCVDRLASTGRYCCTRGTD